MRFRFCFPTLLLLPFLFSGTVAAQPLTGSLEPETVAVADLKPGQFRWTPQRATSGAVEIVISLGQQQAYVFRGGKLIGQASVSTGTPDRATPPGRFRILQKKRFHRSNKYDDAPMPYMMRLTWSGIALHAGHNPGYPASHGCIRLPSKFAAALFAVSPLQTRVVIIDEIPANPQEALQLARSFGASSLPLDNLPVEAEAGSYPAPTEGVQ